MLVISRLARLDMCALFWCICILFYNIPKNQIVLGFFLNFYFIGGLIENYVVLYPTWRYPSTITIFAKEERPASCHEGYASRA